MKLDLGLIEAMRKFADWARANEFDHGPAWLYVHTDPDGYRRKFMFAETLVRAADVLAREDIAILKLRHIERIMGADWVAEIMRARG